LPGRAGPGYDELILPDVLAGRSPHWKEIVVPHRNVKWLVASTVAAASLVAAVCAADPLSPRQFGKLHALIKPAAGEDKWAEIPWLTDLWEARKRAAGEGKPILLWEMDGHPLGCT
jgi:hypothetical protein